MTETTPSTPPASPEAQGTPPATTPSPSPTSPPAADERKFSQAELDAIIADRLGRERKSAEDKAKKERDDAEAKRLREQQEFKALADQHEAKVKELEPQVTSLTERLDRITKLLAEQIASETKEWPAEAKALIPDGDDVLARFEAVQRARPLVAKLAEAPRTPGNPPSPKPAGAPGSGAADDSARQSQASWLNRRF